MSYLVNDFLIEPVLRHARHFSRSNTPRDTIPSRSPSSTRSNEDAVENIAEHFGNIDISKTGTEETNCSNYATVLDTPLESSPTQEGRRPINNVQGGHELGFPIMSTTSWNIVPEQQETPPLSDNGSVENLISDNPHQASLSPSQINFPAVSSINPINENHETQAEDTTEINSRRSTLDEMSARTTSIRRTSSLPEDDGMGALRQQILAIQAMDIETNEKARLMHRLLNRNYSEAQELSKQQVVPATPSNIISQERPTTPGSLSFFLWQMNGSPDYAAKGKNYIFQLSPEDLKPSYVELDVQENDDSSEVGIKDETVVLGCRHYQRNVKLQCSACEKWYTCRLCHDDVEDHVLDRKATKNMLCMICGYAQRAGEFCVECGERTAWYYCEVCKLWDNDASKSIYHCNDCGICRKGLGIGKDFFHCKTCGTCLSTAVEHSHKCIERVSDCNCPICREYMFTSPSPVVFMPCGHSIHKACYDEHLKLSYKCPICSKSTINMETQFRNLDRAVDSQPMPPQFRGTKAMVSCNDCFAKSAVPYHWLGLKCAICGSYNTAQLSILRDPAVDIIVEAEQSVDQATLDLGAGDTSLTRLGHGPPRQRRHSTYVHQAGSIDRYSRRLSPTLRPQRISRSISPRTDQRFNDDITLSQVLETDESAEEDELDFWGLDEPRSTTSGDNLEEEEEEEEAEDDSDDDDDDDSGLEECEEGDEEEDDFALFGHR